jgi:hypothetical protein
MIMSGILIAEREESGSVVRSALGAIGFDGDVTYVRSATELLRSAGCMDPNLVVIDGSIAAQAGPSSFDSLRQTAPCAEIVVVGDHLPAWLQSFCGVALATLEGDDLCDTLERALGRARDTDLFPTLPGRDDSDASCALHAVRNRLAALVVCLRAYCEEVSSVASEPDEVRRATREYGPRLDTIVRDLIASTAELHTAEQTTDEHG